MTLDRREKWFMWYTTAYIWEDLDRRFSNFCAIFTFPDRCEKNISPHYWKICWNLSVTLNFLVFFWIFLLWHHEKRRPCLMTSHQKYTTFLKSLKRKDKNHKRTRFHHWNLCITIFLHSQQLHFNYLKSSSSLTL